ncbi:hypothetical protein VYA_40570 [Vibrio alfacsensis]|nr:hypothetical protein VYA_40570 [Vibrio alfacsensis]
MALGKFSDAMVTGVKGAGVGHWLAKLSVFTPKTESMIKVNIAYDRLRFLDIQVTSLAVL